MTKKEAEEEIKKLKKRKAMFARRYTEKILELNEEIERLRKISGGNNE